MALDRLVRANVGYFIALPEAVPTFFQNGTVTTTQLNGNLVYDVTCALTEADTTFSLDDSDTDDELTFCSIGNEVTPTTRNASAVFTFLRDASKTADTVFNLARDLMSYPDVQYVLIERLFKPNTAAFAIGDQVSLIGVTTDLPVDVIADGANVKGTQNFVSTGDIAWNQTVAA
jgi:hypothetical protein